MRTCVYVYVWGWGDTGWEMGGTRKKDGPRDIKIFMSH